MDDFNPNDFGPHGNGGMPDDAEFQKVHSFMNDITRGITAKIPENILEYVPEPSVKEIDAAAVYLARNYETSVDNPVNKDSLLASTVVMVRASIYDAVEKNVKLMTEDRYRDFCKLKAEEVFYTELQSKGYVDFVFGDDPENPNVELALTEEGRKEFAPLYLAEKKKMSYYTETLEGLLGSKAETDELVNKYLIDQTDQAFGGSNPLGKLLKDILSSPPPDDNLPPIPPSNP